MTSEQLELRRTILEAFAATGEPPHVADSADLRALAAAHVIVVDDTGDNIRIVMAHPFAGHERGARVDAGGRTWWGNCAWDGFGIVHALGLRDATITAQGITLDLRDAASGQGIAVGVRDAVVATAPNILFEIRVPARHWWDDIVHT